MALEVTRVIPRLSWSILRAQYLSNNVGEASRHRRARMLGFESCDGRTHLKVWSRTNWGLGAVAVSAILAIFALGFAFGVHKHASQQVPPSDSPQVIARLNDLDAAVRKLSLGQLQPSDVIAATRDS